MITYNNIIDVFRYFANNHEQINTFFVGEISDYQARENIYSTMIIIPQPSEISKRIIKLNFNCFFIDLLNRDNSNVEEVQSDMELIARDFIKYIDKNFNKGDISFRISDDIITSEPLFEILDDIVAGWMINFSIEYPFINNCDIPFTITEPQPSPCECPENVVLYNITSYTETSVTFDTNIAFYRSPVTFGICNSDSSDSCDYISYEGSYIEGGELGYLFTFILDEITPSISELGQLYIVI